MAGSTFSETWHRVAQARVGLLPSVAVHKQRFRGADWFVLTDTYTQRFFRVTPEAWRFVARLTPERSVDELWRTFIERHPEQAPGQEDVIQVLAQLHHANLLYYGNRPDSLAIFDRYREHRQRELRGKLLGFLYVRIPLWDPNDWLGRIRPFVHLATSRAVAFVALAVMLAGAGVAIANAGDLVEQTQGLLAPGNLGWLYLCMAGMKVLHELGHAFAVKRFGGNVHVLGIMLLVFVPLPYVDATASWGFRRRRERMLVGGIGILIELLLAAMAALVWAATGPGLVNGLAFNVMIIGSVSSLIFNGNPLLRFDAYYVFSDLIDIPNLYQRSSQQWLYFADRWLLGTPTAESPARDAREWWWMTFYGAASFFYRILVVTAILLFVSDEWFAVGVLFAFTTLVMLVLMPGWKWISHLLGDRVHRNRPRAMAASVALVLLPLALLAWMPLPASIKAPGVIEAEQASAISATVSGMLEDVAVEDGARLEAGAIIARLSNPDLVQELRILRQQMREHRLLRNRALERDLSELAPLEERLAYLAEREAELLRRRDELALRAPHDGVWVSEGLRERLGTWVGRGETIGQLVDDRVLRFTAVVSQEQADRLFEEIAGDGALRIRGQTDHTVAVPSLGILPYQRQQLPSAALGWLGGGDVAVRTDEEGGQVAVESFYEVRASLPADESAVTLAHGMSGWLRLPLPAEPALTQLGRSLRQLLQKRYQL